MRLTRHGEVPVSMKRPFQRSSNGSTRGFASSLPAGSAMEVRGVLAANGRWSAVGDATEQQVTCQREGGDVSLASSGLHGGQKVCSGGFVSRRPRAWELLAAVVVVAACGRTDVNPFDVLPSRGGSSSDAGGTSSQGGSFPTAGSSTGGSSMGGSS